MSGIKAAKNTIVRQRSNADALLRAHSPVHLLGGIVTTMPVFFLLMLLLAAVSSVRATPVTLGPETSLALPSSLFTTVSWAASRMMVRCRI